MDNTKDNLDLFIKDLQDRLIKNDYEEILEYIHSHLDECAVSELEWLNDFDPEDAVTMEDIRYVE